MALLASIIGVSQSGKTTIFKALTSTSEKKESKHQNISTIPIPDDRLNDLAKAFSSKKITPATLEFVDLPALKKDATAEEISDVLSQVKKADLFVHIVRCFENEFAPHPDGSLDPIRDINNLDFELIFADLNSVEKRIERTSKLAKSGDEKAKAVLNLMQKLKIFLESEKPLRLYQFTEEEKQLIMEMEFLSDKPVIYVGNLNEDSEKSLKLFEEVEKKAKEENTFAIKIFGKVEAELSELSDDEKKEFLSSYGLEKSGLERLLKVTFDKLDLMTFLTAGEKESRAWTIKKGTKAPQAGGKIHSDIERGFIRVEVYSYEDWVKCDRDEKKVKEKGLLRVEGRNYTIREGDICLFRFNV